jgi:hypothetical protein
MNGKLHRLTVILEGVNLVCAWTSKQVHNTRGAKRMHTTRMEHAETKHAQDRHNTCRQSYAHARAETTKRMPRDKTSMKHAERLHTGFKSKYKKQERASPSFPEAETHPKTRGRTS